LDFAQTVDHARPTTVEIGRSSKDIEMCAALVPELTGFNYDKLRE
jgi:hypothetical protein